MSDDIETTEVDTCDIVDTSDEETSVAGTIAIAVAGVAAGIGIGYGVKRLSEKIGDKMYDKIVASHRDDKTTESDQEK